MYIAGHLIFDDQEYDQVFHLRLQNKTTILNPDQLASYALKIEIIANQFLKKFETDPLQFVRYLDFLRENFIRLHGFAPTKAKTCAEAVLNMAAASYIEGALTSYNRGELRAFIAFYDCLSGVMEVTASILGAVSEEEGGGKKAADYGAIKILQESNVLPSNEEEELYQKALNEYLSNRKFLEKDQTGFLLISKVVEDIQDEATNPEKRDKDKHKKIFDYQYPILVISGAQFAKSIYKELYNVWEIDNG